MYLFKIRRFYTPQYVRDKTNITYGKTNVNSIKKIDLYNNFIMRILDMRIFDALLQMIYNVITSIRETFKINS